MKKVVITGGSGLLGPSVIQEFLDHGYDVLNVDRQLPKEPLCNSLIADLTNLGEVYGVLQGADAVVHLAAIPRPGIHTNEVTFENNTVTTYNILEACGNLGIKKAVITSSESAYGLVFPTVRLEPQYVPLDEAHPALPQDPYGLSKIVNEQTGEMIHRRTGMQVVSLRIGNVIAPHMYADFPDFIHKPEVRRKIMWSYIDARDAASAYRLAVEKDGLGAVALNVAADDTSMDIKSEDLMKEIYPEVEIRGPLGDYETLFSNKKAKKLLDWKPVHKWRDYVKL
ncbi:NAD-dependent epimerase/dehydratase family protein [Radiobacillus sp. PE A8.2]|uniref:NAD-dependent epimerase/dehydratase family protein n=1 Tax=Radiobacillus sp. PE A8.2 TaxID=3380349 RepID=UPI00388D50F0